MVRLSMGARTLVANIEHPGIHFSAMAMRWLSLMALFLCVLYQSSIAGAVAISGVVTGRNITIWDGQAQACHECNNWYVGSGVGMEDQEVEYRSVRGQGWDLEAFYWNGDIDTLFVVAGFDFKNGYSGMAAGDIFLFGGLNQPDYVIDFRREADPSMPSDHHANLYLQDKLGEYQIRSGIFNPERLAGGSSTTAVSYQQKSNPYTYEGAYDSGLEKGTYAYYDNLSDDPGYGIQGDQTGPSHFTLKLPLTGLLAEALGSGYRLHMTLECGNDALAGAIPNPEPATLALFGIGLIVLACFSRKLLKK